jgi:hypothetical protein
MFILNISDFWDVMLCSRLLTQLMFRRNLPPPSAWYLLHYGLLFDQLWGQSYIVGKLSRFPCGRAVGHEADRSPTITEVKKLRIHTAISPYVLMMRRLVKHKACTNLHSGDSGTCLNFSRHCSLDLPKSKFTLFVGVQVQ